MIVLKWSVEGIAEFVVVNDFGADSLDVLDQRAEFLHSSLRNCAPDLL